MKSFLTLLILASAVCVGLANITGEEEPFLLECRIPEDATIVNKSAQMDLTEQERAQLVAEGRCFLTCVGLQYSSEVAASSYDRVSILCVSVHC